MKKYNPKNYLGRNLQNICNYFAVRNKITNKVKNEINYVFGVPFNELKKVENLEQLTQKIIQYKTKKSDFQDDLENGINEMLSLI